MVQRFTIGLVLLAFPMFASAAIVTINDFEGGTTTGSGPNNGGLIFLSSTTPSTSVDVDFTDSAASTTGGLGGFATVLTVTPAATSMYDSLFDLNYQ